MILGMRVLITGAGGPAAISFMRGVSTSPLTADFVMADMDPIASGLHLVPASQRVILPAGRSPDFGDALLAACVRQQVQVLVPTVDDELIAVARMRPALEARGVRCVLSPLSALRTCLDKWLLAQRCEGVVPLPTTAVFDDTFDASRFSGKVIVKPRRGSGSRGIRLLDIEEVDALPRDAEQIVQGLLPGAEYSVDVFVDQGAVTAVPRERAKVDSGVAVVARIVPDEVLEQTAMKIALAVGIEGVANVQLRRDDNGVPNLLEVNPRFPGTMPITVAAGVNMPALALQQVLGMPRETGPLPYQAVAMVRTFHEHYLPVEELGRIAAASGEESDAA